MKRLVLILALLICQSSMAATQYVYNVTKKQVVTEYSSDLVRPIASVTKLMTALVIVESELDMGQKVPYRGSRNVRGKPRTREELLSIMLVKSDNNAAEALADSYPGGRSSFIAMMNKKAYTIGMNNTRYQDPSGLGIGNQSTAKDISTLLNYCYNYFEIRRAASLTSYIFAEPVSKKRSKEYRLVHVNNTNFRLLNEYEEIEISKTGFTNPAGKCLAMFIRKHGDSYTIVILGERDMKAVEKVSRNIIDNL